MVGQLTIVGAADPGYITAFGCDTESTSGPSGGLAKSDLNFDGRLGPARSNRLIVQADDDGDICLFSTREVDVIVDVNGVADAGITSFPNRRIDTRRNTNGSIAPSLAAGQVLRIAVPESVGAKTVIGQLTVDRTGAAGFVTAFGCDDGLPGDVGGDPKSDLNYDGAVVPVWSNRLIVQADRDGDICLFTSAAVDLIVDINGIASNIGIFSFPNQRTDTRSGTRPPATTVPTDAAGVPLWPPFTPRSAPTSLAALTGNPVDTLTANRPILAVKIDNFRRARPQFGLDRADAIIEENVEGVTRFIALYQTQLPGQVGPVRSARTGDIDLLAGMNRPVFGYSGANAGVTTWIRTAAESGVLVDFSALSSPCYVREPGRPAPHNLLLDASCATSVAAARTPGQARPLWTIDGAWTPPPAMGATLDTTFGVRMDGVQVEWTWNPGAGLYVRSQDGAAHVAASGARIAAAQRGGDRRDPRAVTCRRSITQPDHRRQRHRDRPPRRRRDQRNVVAGNGVRSVRIPRHCHRQPHRARNRHDLHPPHARRLTRPLRQRANHPFCATERGTVHHFSAREHGGRRRAGLDGDVVSS